MTHTGRTKRKRRKTVKNPPFPPLDFLGILNAVFGEPNMERVRHSRRVVHSIIDEPRMKQLISLCHPDKHNGSESAKEATIWLLEIRKNGGIIPHE